MNLLFIQGGSRLKLSDKGLWYTDPNFTMEVWKRYISLCDHLTIVLRREDKIYADEECKAKFSPMPHGDAVSIVPVSDFMTPKWRLLNFFMRLRVNKIIENEIEKVDKVIIRSATEYCGMAMNACIRHKKPYLMEVTGFALEGLSHHSLLGKLSAGHFERLTKTIAANADAAIYVTDEALQKRYPCKKMLGCSDVVLQPADEGVLEARIQKISARKPDTLLRIGTAAFLDVMWKGQHNVIRAIAELKKKGLTNIQYEMIGTGKGVHLIKLAEELGVANQVKILGARPHDEVFKWLDNIDIYVQPSYQEGLCRAIAEAISRACPVIASDTGGNYELISREYIFPCGDYHKLASLIAGILPNLSNEAMRNFEHSRHYDKNRLDTLRFDFFKEFINNSF